MCFLALLPYNRTLMISLQALQRSLKCFFPVFYIKHSILYVFHLSMDNCVLCSGLYNIGYSLQCLLTCMALWFTLGQCAEFSITSPSHVSQHHL